MHSLWFSPVVALALSLYALAGWLRGRQACDLLFGGITLGWFGLLLADALVRGQLVGAGFGVLAATRGLYLCVALGVGVFLLKAGGLWGPRTRWGAGLLAPVLLLLSPGVLLDWPAPWLHVWTWSLALGAAALVCALALAAWHRGGGPGGQAWMALAAGIFGLAVLLTDLDAYASAATVRLSVLHYFFYALLFVLWMMVSARMGTPAASDGEPAAEQAVRRRLAQDLHDGVGSQLVSIISGLSMGTPQQRATAASLQECVVELKLLVDGMSHEASVLAHLASLRYRMQPLMAAAGMRLHWEIADEDLLEQVQGDAARQVLRMAQEALANVVRHSDADEVLVSCRHDKQGDALVLEVADNGVGMAPALRTAPALDESAAAGGRGLVGMERRARRLGGRLRIEAAHGQGTRVRLLLPMAGLHAASMPWLPTQ